MNKNKRLGLDFGKVIMGAVHGGQADTSFLGSKFADAMKTPAEPGAIDAVKKLVDEFDGAVWIVSKCGPSVEQKTRGWLSHHQFYERTGLEKENLRFCRKRPDKAPICRDLGITHFVDDRADVLRPMRGVVENLYLFGEQKAAVPGFATPVLDWAAVLRELLAPGAVASPGPRR